MSRNKIVFIVVLSLFGAIAWIASTRFSRSEISNENMDNKKLAANPKGHGKNLLEFKRVEPVDGTPFKISLIEDYKNLLRIDDRISIIPLQSETIRDSAGALHTTFWAKRAANAFSVDWVSGATNIVKVDNSKAGDSPIPQEAELKTSFAGGSFEQKSAIGLRIGDSLKTFDWPYKTMVADLVVSRKYSRAFGLEIREENPKAIGIVWLDINAGKVGKIKIPEARQGVHVVYKEEMGVLLVFDSEWHWIMCVDLKM